MKKYLMSFLAFIAIAASLNTASAQSNFRMGRMRY